MPPKTQVSWELSKQPAYIHVIHITRIGHLLHINSCLLLCACLHPDDGLFHHILQVGKASPNIAHVLKGISTGTRIPVPVPRERNLSIRNPHHHIPHKKLFIRQHVRTHPSLILLVLSTLSISMRILYFTCWGSSMLLGAISVKTMPAQNLLSSRSSNDLFISRTSVATGSSLSKLTH